MYLIYKVERVKMLDIEEKLDNAKGQHKGKLYAAEFDSVANEIRNAIKLSTNVLDASDDTQLATAIENYFGSTILKDNGGAANAYKVTRPKLVKKITSLQDNDIYLFLSNMVNTGAANLTIDNMAPKDIYKDNAPLKPGAIPDKAIVAVIYKQAQGRFELLTVSGDSSGTAGVVNTSKITSTNGDSIVADCTNIKDILQDGTTILLVPNAVNTGHVTLDASGTGAKNIYVDGSPLAGGDFAPGRPALVRYSLVADRYDMLPFGSSNIAEGQDIGIDTSTTVNQVVLGDEIKIVKIREGATIDFIANTENTGATTLSIPGFGVNSLKFNGAELLQGILQQNKKYTAKWTTDHWELVVDYIPTAMEAYTVYGSIMGIDSGTTDAYKLANIQTEPVLDDGLIINFIPATTNTGAATVEIDDKGSKQIYYNGAQVSAGKITAGKKSTIIYDKANDRFNLMVDGADIDTLSRYMQTGKDSGAANAIILPNVKLSTSGLKDGEGFSFILKETNTGNTTLTADGITKNVFVNGKQPKPGALVAGNNYVALFDKDNDRFNIDIGNVKNIVLTGIAGGTGDDIVLTSNIIIDSYYTGMLAIFKGTAFNTGPTTININGIGAVSIKFKGNNLLAKAIKPDEMVILEYDGTNFELSTIGGVGAYEYVNADKLLEAGKRYRLDTAGTALTTGNYNYTVTLPVSPSANDFIYLVDNDGNAQNRPIKIDGNGKNILGNSIAVLDVNGYASNLVYTGTQWTLAGD